MKVAYELKVRHVEKSYYVAEHHFKVVHELKVRHIETSNQGSRVAHGLKL